MYKYVRLIIVFILFNAASHIGFSMAAPVPVIKNVKISNCVRLAGVTCWSYDWEIVTAPGEMNPEWDEPASRIGTNYTVCFVKPVGNQLNLEEICLPGLMWFNYNKSWAVDLKTAKVSDIINAYLKYNPSAWQQVATGHIAEWGKASVAYCLKWFRGTVKPGSTTNVQGRGPGEDIGNCYWVENGQLNETLKCSLKQPSLLFEHGTVRVGEKSVVHQNLEIECNQKASVQLFLKNGSERISLGSGYTTIASNKGPLNTTFIAKEGSTIVDLTSTLSSLPAGDWNGSAVLTFYFP